MKRLVLVLALILVLPRLALGELLAPEVALAMAERGEILIIDIRRPSEWAETGLPSTSVGVSLQNAALLPRWGFGDDVLAMVDGDLDRPIALICAAGVRSSLAAKLLDYEGFTQVYDIGEGMLGSSDGPGWVARDLPTEPCTVCEK